MNSRSGLRVIVAAMVLIVSVVALSRIFTGMWGGKMEGAAAPAPIAVRPDMTVGQFGRENRLFRIGASAGLREPEAERSGEEDRGYRHPWR